MFNFKILSWYCLLIFQVFSCGSYSIFVHLCEKDGKISFSSSAMNLTIESLKLIFSIIGTIFEMNNNSFSFKKSIHFGIPAFLYFVNNNLAVYIQLYMDSASYQLLSNLKILTTSIMYYFVFGTKMTMTDDNSVHLLDCQGKTCENCGERKTYLKFYLKFSN